MPEGIRIFGHYKGSATNEQIQAQVVELLQHNALAVVPVDSLGSPIDLSGGALVPEAYDYLLLAYDGSDNLTTVTYKSGGSGGTTVATLTLAYTGSNLTSVTRS